GLRPDGGTALGDIDGLLREWRRVLSLFLFRRARLRPYRAGRYLRAGLPAHGRGAGLWHSAAAKENSTRRHKAGALMSVENLESLGDYIEAVMQPSILKKELVLGELSFTVRREGLRRFITFLLNDANCDFRQLVSICGVDYPERDERFEVVY